MWFELLDLFLFILMSFAFSFILIKFNVPYKEIKVIIFINVIFWIIGHIIGF
jgi:hypothetical protein